MASIETFSTPCSSNSRAAASITRARLRAASARSAAAARLRSWMGIKGDIAIRTVVRYGAPRQSGLRSGADRNHRGASMSTTVSAPALPAAAWRVDPSHSYVGFEVKHLGISTFRGRFTDVEGVVRTDGGELAAVDGIVRLASVLTNDERL